MKRILSGGGQPVHLWQLYRRELLLWGGLLLVLFCACSPVPSGQKKLPFLEKSREARTAARQAADPPAAIVSPSPTAPVPTQTSGPYDAVATLPAIPEAACVPSDTPREVGQVVQMIDGDTIDVNIDGQVLRVRYIGIDAPGRGEPRWGRAAQLNQDLVYWKQVTLVMDTSRTDSEEPLLRYVFVEDRFVNYELVRAGCAAAVSDPPDLACQATFVAAEQAAGECQR